MDSNGNFYIPAAGTGDTGVIYEASPTDHLVFSQQPTGGPAYSKMAPVIVKIEDNFGHLVTADNSSVALSISGTKSSTPVGTATILGTMTAAAVHGVATFTGLIPTTTGAYTLTAADGADVSAGSAAFTVKAADVKLAFTQKPTQVIAGATIGQPVTVCLENAFGRSVTTFDGDYVVLLVGTISPPGPYGVPPIFAVWPGQTPEVTLSFPASGSAGASTDAMFGAMKAHPVNGVATFSQLSIPQSGTHVLGAMLVAPGGSGPIYIGYPDANSPWMIPGASDGIIQTVASAISSQFTAVAPVLAFARQPVNVAAGSDMAPAVVINIEDQTGRILTTDNFPVTISVASGPPGWDMYDTFTVNAVHGVAVFPDLVFYTVGTYTLTAGNAGGTVNSQGFTVG
jgi:hypothetical protein